MLRRTVTPMAVTLMAVTLLALSVTAQHSEGRVSRGDGTSVANPESASVALAGETPPPQEPPPPPPPPAPQANPKQTARSARGSTPPPPPPPPQAPAKFRGQPINVKVEAVISDQRSSSEPVRKMLSVIVGDGLQGMVRSDSVFAGGIVGGAIPLHMDATPEILADSKIRLSFGLEYDLPRPGGSDNPSPGAPSPNRTEIREHLTVILENGKPLVVSQSADPVSERHVTVELKATILK